MFKTRTCPYNGAHQMKPSKIHAHLVKCREKHPEIDRFICPYNATHHIPREEEQDHLTTCPDKKIVEMAKYSWLYNKPGQQGNLTNPVPNSANIPVEEESELDENGNNRGPKEFSVTRPVFSSLRDRIQGAQVAPTVDRLNPLRPEQVENDGNLATLPSGTLGSLGTTSDKKED